MTIPSDIGYRTLRAPDLLIENECCLLGECLEAGELSSVSWLRLWPPRRVAKYKYWISEPGGGKQQKSVQHQTMDRIHPGQPHWGAGAVKLDDHGDVGMNNYDRPKLANPKSKVDD